MRFANSVKSTLILMFITLGSSLSAQNQNVLLVQMGISSDKIPRDAGLVTCSVSFNILDGTCKSIRILSNQEDVRIMPTGCKIDDLHIALMNGANVNPSFEGLTWNWDEQGYLMLNFNPLLTHNSSVEVKVSLVYEKLPTSGIRISAEVSNDGIGWTLCQSSGSLMYELEQ